MKISRAALAAGALLSLGAAIAPAAQADTVSYDWTLSSTISTGNGGYTDLGTGTLTVDTSQTKTIGGFTGDLITSLTGTLSSGATVNLLAPGAFGTSLYSNDDYFFPTGSSLVDLPYIGNSYVGGVGFASAAGNFLLVAQNIEGGSPAGATGYQEIAPTGGSLGVGAFTATLAPVPLPASLWMMILGLGGLGFAALRKKQSKDGATGFFTA